MLDGKLAVVGLGYVGLPLAVEFGKIRSTLGFDIDKSRVDELGSHFDRTLELTAEAMKCATELEFSSNSKELADCNIFIVTVPTPIDEANRPNLGPITKATELIAGSLSAGNFVIFESTVFPGCTEDVCVPILEQLSGLKFNVDFFCGYSPERINPGDKVNTLTKITKITSGSTPQASAAIDDLYGSIIEAGTFRASSIRVAEAAKVIENTQRDLNIALVNELSLIFARVGIDTLEVLEAAGSKWNFLPFRPGLVGGHCIGVDPYYLTHKAELEGYHPEIILAGRRINDNMSSVVAQKVIQGMLKSNVDVGSGTVGVMGITFKENCPDIRNSKVVDVISELRDWNLNVLVSDPWADVAEVKEQYGLTLVEINKHHKVDALIVAVGHDEYRNLTPKQLKELCKSGSPVIFDVKSQYDRHDLQSEGFMVLRL